MNIVNVTVNTLLNMFVTYVTMCVIFRALFTLPGLCIFCSVFLGNKLKYYFNRAGLYFDRSKYILHVVNWTL
jgi:hypothetical protein